MNILITGGAGFVGSQVGYYLKKKGHSIYLLDNMSYGHEDNLTIDGEPIGEFIHGDIRKYCDSTLKEKNIEVVLHFAGVAPLPECQEDPYNAIDNNVAGTACVLESCRLAGVKKVVFASTSAVYENCKKLPFVEHQDLFNPDLIYSLTKLQSELLCDSFVKNYDMDIVKLRFFNVYGPHQDFERKQPPLMGYIIKCLLNKTRPTFFSDGKQKRDYVYITDLANMVECVLNKDGLAGEVFNVCSGEVKSVREIYDTYQEAFGIHIDPVFSNSDKFWNKYSSLFKQPYSLNRERVIEEVNKFSEGSFEKAENMLGWKPKVGYKQGINNCVSYALSSRTRYNMT
jgi:UDP-glucose 4-epimerase